MKLSGTRLNLAIAVAALLYLVSQTWLAGIYHPLGTASCLRFWLAVKPETVMSVLNAWGPEGIAQFRRHYQLDFIHPLLYGALLYLLMLRFCTGLPAAGLLRKLPWLASASDLIENLLQLRVLAQAPTLDALTVFASGSFARAKWTLALVCVLIVVAGIVQTLLRALASRRRSAA